MPLIITAMGWWKYANHRTILGVRVPWSTRETALSGLAFAVIIWTTTLAYTLPGIPIVMALLLMRGGVLTIAPIVDRLCNRTVRWYSWTALALSLGALVVAFSDVGGCTFTLAAVANLSAYLAGYVFRLPLMSRYAKLPDRNITRGFFVEESLAAMVALVAVPLILAAAHIGPAGTQLRYGFTAVLASDLAAPALLVECCYACLAIFGTLERGIDCERGLSHDLRRRASVEFAGGTETCAPISQSDRGNGGASRGDLLHDGKQSRTVMENFPASRAKTYALDPERDIEDPSGAGPDVYLKVARHIAEMLGGRLDTLLPEQA